MTASIALSPILHFDDSARNPLVGGKLYTYITGTTTPQATYTDAAGVSPNTNPIILNARGECTCWFGAGLTYKLVLQDSLGNGIWSADGVSGAEPSGALALLLASNTLITQGAGAVSINHGLTYNINTTGYDINYLLSVVYAAVLPSMTTTQIQTVLSSGARFVRAIRGAYAVDTLTIPSGVSLILDDGAVFTFAAHATSHNPMIRMGTSGAAVDGARLVGGKLIGNSAGQTFGGEQWSPGVFIWGSNNCEVIGVEITDCKGDGITIGFDSARQVGSNGNTVERCYVHDNMTGRQAISITYGCENKILHNRVKGTIDLELDASIGECKNNLVSGNSGVDVGPTDTVPRTSTLAISLSSLNTDTRRYFGNQVVENTCLGISGQYNSNTLIRGNVIIGSDPTSTFLLDLAACGATQVQGNQFIANPAVAVALTGIIRTRGCGVLSVIDNVSRGDSSSIPFHAYIATFAADTATDHTFYNNKTESGYYRNGDCWQASEWGRFMITNVNGGAIAITQVAGVNALSSVSRSGANAVVASIGNAGSKWTMDFLRQCNATVAAVIGNFYSTDMTHNCTSSFTVSGTNKTTTVFTFTPGAGTPAAAAFSFAAGGGTGTFFVDVWF